MHEIKLESSLNSWENFRVATMSGTYVKKRFRVALSIFVEHQIFILFVCGHVMSDVPCPIAVSLQQEQHSVVRFCCLLNKTPTQMYSMIYEAYGDESLSRAMTVCFRWGGSYGLHHIFKRTPTEEFSKTIKEKWAERWNLCIKRDGRYFEKEKNRWWINFFLNFGISFCTKIS